MARCSVGSWVLIEIYVKTLVLIILFLILVIRSKAPAHIVEAGDLLLLLLYWIKAVVNLSLNWCKSFLLKILNACVCVWDHQASTLLCLPARPAVFHLQRKPYAPSVFPWKCCREPWPDGWMEIKCIPAGERYTVIKPSSEPCHLVWRTRLLWYPDRAQLPALNL